MTCLNNLMKKFYPDVTLQLPTEALALITDTDSFPCISIKHQDKGYIFANNNFLYLNGLTSVHSIIFKKDIELTRKANLAKFYEEEDQFTISSEKPNSVKGSVEPKNHPHLVKAMYGKIYPLYLNSDKPNAVLGIYMPQNQLLSLDIDQALRLSGTELKQVLTRKSYTVKIKNIEIKISKAEILCLIELLKGKHAGEIAKIFNLKQVTVESYIKNLKNKCGVSLKGDLIAFFLENNILQKILV